MLNNSLRLFHIEDTLMEFTDPRNYLPQNKYIQCYFRIVDKRLKQPPSSPRVEIHHILPSSMFPEYITEPKNLVKLTIREHFICHLLLWAGCRNPQMTRAFHLMSHTRGIRINSKTYEKMLSDYRDLPSPLIGRTVINKEGRVKCVDDSKLEKFLSRGWSIGGLEMAFMKRGNRSTKIVVEEIELYLEMGWERGHAFKTNNGLKAINKNGKLKYVNEEELELYLSNGWKPGTTIDISGSIVMNDGKRDILVKPDDVERFEAEGWSKGRFFDDFTGRIAINNGIENKYIREIELETYLSNGWQRGTKRKMNSGRKTINDGKVAKMVLGTDIEKYLSSGWKMGQLPKSREV